MASDVAKEKFRDSLAAGIDKYVKMPGRNTISQNCERDSGCAGYARIPSPDACDFCVTMGASNDFYHSEATAGGGLGHGTADDAYHPYCNCQIAMIFKKSGRYVAKDPETGSPLEYDGKKLVERYNEIGRPTYANKSVRGGKGSTKPSVLPQDKFDEAMKMLADAKTVDELHDVGGQIVAGWPKRKAGRDPVQWKRMSSFAKNREMQLASVGVEELRIYTPSISIKVPDFSQLSSKQFKKLSEHEKEGFKHLAALKHDVVVLPNVRSAPANIDMIMDGEYWELKTPIKDGGRLKTRLGEGVSKWDRLKDSNIDGLGTPKIVVDNRFCSLPDKEAIRIIRECMYEFKEGNFNEAMIIRKNGRTSRIKK